jgi:hypothetical protein
VVHAQAKGGDARDDQDASGSAPSLRRAVVAAAAALAMTLTTMPASVVWADEAPVSAETAVVAAVETDATSAAVAFVEVVAGEEAAAAAAAASSSSTVAEDAEEEVLEISFEEVEVGTAPDIAAQKAKVEGYKEKGLTELEQKAVENNTRIKQYNNAPAEFPTFVREGYDVRCITTPGFVTQDDGLVYKVGLLHHPCISRRSRALSRPALFIPYYKLSSVDP